MLLSFTDLKALHVVTLSPPHGSDAKPFEQLCYIPASLNRLKSTTSAESWKDTSMCLMHLRVLHNLSRLAVEEKIDNKSLFDILLSTELWDVLQALCVSTELVVAWSARRLIAAILCVMYKLPNQQKWVEAKVEEMFSRAVGCTNSLFFSVAMMTTIIKHSPLSESDSTRMQRVMGTLLEQIQTRVSDPLHDEDFFTCLQLMHAVHDNGLSSHHIQCLLLNVTALLIHGYALHCNRPLFRLKYFKLLRKTFLDCATTTNIAMTLSETAQSYIVIVRRTLLHCDMLFQPKMFGFGGIKAVDCKNDTATSIILSAPEIMLLTNSLLCAMAIVCKHRSADTNLNDWSSCIERLFSRCLTGQLLVNKVLSVFFEQDDLLIELLLLHLSVCSSSARCSSVIFLFSPHAAFLNLIHRLSYDSSVLLDWLTSNETSFLLYFVKYLKYASTMFDAFCAACEPANSDAPASDQDSATMTNLMLTKLMTSIERLTASNLFPYSSKPLLRNINKFLLLLRRRASSDLTDNATGDTE